MVQLFENFETRFFFFDFDSGRQRSHTWQGNFLGWSADGSHIVYEVLSAGAGYGPRTLYLRDIRTGNERIIYRQTFQPYLDSHQSGSQVFSFVGVN
ncbi:MAG: hypothetical protein HYZ09_02545 [Candidatus Kerfeldbacteria bacterium]|nr:hypothetical protein [Candidatus Kerfeldbacteria bacterium]